MTEPIIIDGINVKGCQYYRTEYKNDNDYIVDGCTLNLNRCVFSPNCYYKQLKRKEQELQEAMDNYVKATNYYEDKLAQIKRIINEVTE